MTKPLPRFGAGLLVLIAAAGCARGPAYSGPRVDRAPIGFPYTEADVHFMSGMIPHHAQAIKIAGWALTHSTTPAVKVLAERIIVAQQDEILIMQNWLRDRGKPVPAADATHLRMKMDGMEHDMLMPGMLNAEDLARLDRARGVEFDRLFLQSMIKHHEGAVTMVNELQKTGGAGQDETVFKLTSDIYADQTTEIDRMQKILAALPPGGRP
jgi:uncharacterized protein (DUF305 family)